MPNASRRPEGLLVVKERYLAVTNYNLLDAYLLSILVALQKQHGAGKWFVRRLKDWEGANPIKAPQSTLKDHLKALTKLPFVDSKGGRGRRTQWVVDLDLLDAIASEKLALMSGFSVDPDLFVPLRENEGTEDRPRLELEGKGRDSSFVTQKGRDSSFVTEKGRDPSFVTNEKVSDSGKKDEIRLSSEEKVSPEEDKKRDPSFETDPLHMSSIYIIPEDDKSVDLDNDKSVDLDNDKSVDLDNDKSMTSLSDKSMTSLIGQDTKLDICATIDSAQNSKNESEAESVTKNDIYTWRHYAQFGQKDWDRAKDEGKFPKKERAATMVIGAFLLAMHKRHNLEIALVPEDFNGKYVRGINAMLKFFTGKNNGDKLAGFRDALRWVAEFTSATDPYVVNASWPIQMFITRDMYRQAGQNAFLKKDSKKRNNTGTVILTPEERIEAQKKGRRL